MPFNTDPIILCWLIRLTDRSLHSEHLEHADAGGAARTAQVDVVDTGLESSENGRFPGVWWSKSTLGLGRQALRYLPGRRCAATPLGGRVYFRLNHSRRLSKSYERLTRTDASWVYIAMTRILLERLA